MSRIGSRRNLGRCIDIHRVLASCDALRRAQLVFNHRFQPFLQLASPEPLSYSRFRESVDATNLDVRTDRQ